MSPAIEAMRAGRERAAERRLVEAREVVAAHREYEVMSASVFAVGRSTGFGSDEHTKAKAALREAFPSLPALPTKAQMVLVYGTPDDE